MEVYFYFKTLVCLEQSKGQRKRSIKSTEWTLLRPNQISQWPESHGNDVREERKVLVHDSCQAHFASEDNHVHVAIYCVKWCSSIMKFRFFIAAPTQDYDSLFTHVWQYSVSVDSRPVQCGRKRLETMWPYHKAWTNDVKFRNRLMIELWAGLTQQHTTT